MLAGALDCVAVVVVRLVVARTVDAPVVRSVVFGGGSATVVVLAVVRGRLSVVAGIVRLVVAVERMGVARCEDEPQPAAASSAKQTEVVMPARATGGQGTRVATCPPSATSSRTFSPTNR